MTKVQVANIISRLPIMPFLGKVEKVKTEKKPEMGIMSQTSEVPQVQQVSQTSEAPRVQQVSQKSEAPRVQQQVSQMLEVPQVQEALQVLKPQATPMTPKRAQSEEIDLEKDAEASGKTIESEKEPSPEAKRTNSYQRYIMPEQKVNEVVKELSYHNMLVVIAVGDKTRPLIT